MAGVKVRIKKITLPTAGDRLFGTLWSWSLYQERVGYLHLVTNGFAYSEKGARRKAHRAAAHLLEANVIEYEYNPEGLL